MNPIALIGAGGSYSYQSAVTVKKRAARIAVTEGTTAYLDGYRPEGIHRLVDALELPGLHSRPNGVPVPQAGERPPIRLANRERRATHVRDNAERNVMKHSWHAPVVYFANGRPDHRSIRQTYGFDFAAAVCRIQHKF